MAPRDGDSGDAESFTPGAASCTPWISARVPPSNLSPSWHTPKPHIPTLRAAPRGGHRLTSHRRAWPGAAAAALLGPTRLCSPPPPPPPQFGEGRHVTAPQDAPPPAPPLSRCSDPLRGARPLCGRPRRPAVHALLWGGWEVQLATCEAGGGRAKGPPTPGTRPDPRGSSSLQGSQRDLLRLLIMRNLVQVL